MTCSPLPGRIFYETNFAPMLRLGGGLEEIALDLTTASGEAAPMLASAVETRDAHGGLVAVKVVLVRAKDRRGYERDLRTREIAAVQRLDDERQTAELREQFIAVLGHDLRNPLASIRAGATLLARGAVETREAKVLALMHASVDRMAALIENVLDFARGRLGGGLSVVRAASPLQPAIEHVIDELRAAHPDRVILSELELQKDVDCDAGRLAQLISNLVGNALIHGAADQPVKVSAGVEDDELEIRVCNGGAPIPAAALPKLFLPFERGAIRPNRHGLGLGLYISSEIARAHGGRLGVVSGKTETVFTFAMAALERRLQRKHPTINLRPQRQGRLRSLSAMSVC